MRKIKYQVEDKGSGSTETHIATDEVMSKKAGYAQNALEEGFAASDGVRGVTAASGGRIKRPEKSDASLIDPVAKSIKSENPGLADN